PVLVRPSYVLGGRAMVIAYDEESVIRYMKEAVEYSQDRPVLIDHFLEDAIEVDVDALSDGDDVVIGGIMQHIEEAGIHSGDSSCVLPAVEIPQHLLDRMPEFIEQQKDLDTGSSYYVKSPVFPWNKFPGVDTVLGPEMKSTGEVMGVADNFGEAFAKAQTAAGQRLPVQGMVFISVTDHDKPQVAEVARKFVDMGFKLVATAGTADVIESASMACERVYKVKEGRP